MWKGIDGISRFSLHLHARAGDLIYPEFFDVRNDKSSKASRCLPRRWSCSFPCSRALLLPTRRGVIQERVHKSLRGNLFWKLVKCFSSPDRHNTATRSPRGNICRKWLGTPHRSTADKVACSAKVRAALILSENTLDIFRIIVSSYECCYYWLYKSVQGISNPACHKSWHWYQ